MTGQTRLFADATSPILDGPRTPAERMSGATIVLVVFWMVALFAGMAGLWKYKLTPGAPAGASPRGVWPAQSHLPVTANMPTLIMFAHPQCVCTRASLAELRTLTSRFGSRIVATVAFLHPTDAPKDFNRSDSWNLAAAIPGVRVLGDQDGREAALFGAGTSGHVVLYSAGGRLLFAGGITAARGHIGGSPQLDTLVGLLESETGGPVATGPVPRLTSKPGSVYGCPLKSNVP